MKSIYDNVLEAKTIARECGSVADQLAFKRIRALSARNLLRASLALIGVIAIIVAYVPSATALVGKSGTNIVSAGAGPALVLSTILPLFIQTDPPERLDDSIRYVRSHQEDIENTLRNQKMTDDEKHDTLLHQINLAQRNLNDIKSKWPDVYSKAIKQITYVMRAT